MRGVFANVRENYSLVLKLAKAGGRKVKEESYYTKYFFA